MNRRYVAIWFPYLATDWLMLCRKDLTNAPLVLKASVRGRMIVTAVNALAKEQGICNGMVLADARAMFPGLQVVDDIPGLADKLLNKLAEWCIRFTPVASADLPDGIILDVTGCSHLWGGDKSYLRDIVQRLKVRGFDARAAIADTIGAAWAVARFSKDTVVPPGHHLNAILSLPAASLRIEPETVERLHKLGLRQISSFINMPRQALSRRFGKFIVMRINQALGIEEEFIQPVHPIVPYQERLNSFEPIVTATGIEIALEQLLTALCSRLKKEQKGLREANLKCYRMDGKMVQVGISTNRPSHHFSHLFKLFAIKLPLIEPDLGIELFVLEAQKVEDHVPGQQKLWERMWGIDHIQLAELVDRLTGKIGQNAIHRFLPEEHYWPERSTRLASTINEQTTTEWRLDRPRPIRLLPTPQSIDVTAPVPDYPPMLFRYKGKLHKVIRADGPERIEQEWWLQEGQHRDYYAVEDEEGHRYWVFRLGHYDEMKSYQWFLHGFFA